MTQFTDFLLVFGSMVFFIFMVFGILNWLSKEFWSKWMKIRISKGKKWLIRVWTPTGNYYAIGRPDGEKVRYKDRNKQFRTITIDDGATYKSFGVDCIETDEATNGVRINKKEGEDVSDKAIKVKGAFYVVPGFDAVTMDSLLIRAYELGKSAKQNKDKIIMLLVFIAIILGLIAVYMGYINVNKIDLLLSIVNKGATI